jgi:hypothetical protein
MITYDVHVTIGTEGAENVPSVKCHDTGVNIRVFPETVAHESKWRKVVTPYRIPEGCTAILKVTKPDGNWVAIEAKTVGDTWMLFELHVQVFTVAGKDEAEVSIYSPEGKRLTTDTFYIEVPKEIIHDGEEGSTSYADVVAEQIANATSGLASKLDKNQGSENAGRVMVVNEEGVPVPVVLDWNAAEEELGHILNRTHYIDENGVVHKLDNKYIDAEWMATVETSGGETILPETTKEFKLPMYTVSVSGTPLVEGEEYDILWNGECYRNTAVKSGNSVYVGNLNIASSTWGDTGEPFCIQNTNTVFMVRKKTKTAETVTFGVTTATHKTYNKLDNQYIDAEWMATKEVTGGEDVFVATELSFASSNILLGVEQKSFKVKVGQEYDVYWNGILYTCTAFEQSSELFLGNRELFVQGGSHLIVCDAPFCFAGFSDTVNTLKKSTDTAETVVVKVATAEKTTYNKLPKEFLPDDVGSGGSLSADWNENDPSADDYIKNRPFYDAGGLEPITWDGVVGDRVTVTFDGLMHVKVSDTVFSANDLVGATISVGSGETGPVDESQVYSIPNVITMYGEFVTSVADIAQVLEKTGLSYPETGTYFASGDAYIASLIFAGGGIKTLDEKFIPDTIARKADVVVEWGKF